MRDSGSVVAISRVSGFRQPRNAKNVEYSYVRSANSTHNIILYLVESYEYAVRLQCVASVRPMRK